jgi:hypothetical protein
LFLASLSFHFVLQISFKDVDGPEIGFHYGIRASKRMTQAAVAGIALIINKAHHAALA